MTTILIISAIINIILLILFIILCMHVSQIKDFTDQNVFAAPYIEQGFDSHKWAADRVERDWGDDALAYCKQSIRNYKIAQYYINQNRLGKIPRFLMEKYTGESDLAEFVNEFIRSELKAVEELTEKSKNS